MFYSKKQIENECQKLYTELKDNLYTEDIVLEKISEQDKPFNERVFDLILELDHMLGVGTLKGRIRLFYWGLMPDERLVLKNICDEANRDNAVDVFYKAFDAYFKIFLDNNLKYDEAKEELDSTNEIRDITRLRESILKYYFTKDVFIEIDKYVRKNRDISKPNPSIATLLWEDILKIDNDVKEWYLNEKNHITSQYYFFTQEELDELFVMCTEGNKLGIKLYLGDKPENGIIHLTDDQVYAISEVGKNVANHYLNILAKKNIEYKNEEARFLNKMNIFGQRHDMSEVELVEFANKAYNIGINLAELETQDELEDIYRIVYPEA